jgi:catechol 2,3-dioxygenase-like lactoylglutathione lyase family enzyme
MSSATIDHVQLAAPAGSEPAAREFYGQLLGLPEIAKPPQLAARGGVWFRLAGTQQLHLGIDRGFTPARKAHPALCFAAAEFDRVAARLTAAGYELNTGDADTIPGVRRLHVHDPFGNRLELLTRD